MSNLDPQEYTRYIAYELNLMTRMDNLYYQYSNGFLDQEYYEEVCEPLIREHAGLWKRLNMLMRAGFREELERIVAASAERADRSRLSRKPEP